MWWWVLVGVVLVPGAVVFVITSIVATSRRRDPLSRLEVRDDVVVVHVDAPVWLCFRRTLTAPRSAIGAVSVLPAGASARLRLRVLGTGWPGLACGYFWRYGRGLCFVVRRKKRDAVEIEVATGRARQWIVEVGSVEEVLRDISGYQPQT